MSEHVQIKWRNSLLIIIVAFVSFSNKAWKVTSQELMCVDSDVLLSYHVSEYGTLLMTFINCVNIALGLIYMIYRVPMTMFFCCGRKIYFFVWRVLKYDRILYKMQYFNKP